MPQRTHRTQPHSLGAPTSVVWLVGYFFRVNQIRLVTIPRQHSIAHSPWVMSASEAAQAPAFDSPTVQAYVASRKFDFRNPPCAETQRRSINAHGFEGVPSAPGEKHAWDYSSKFRTGVVIGQPLKYQDLQPVWPSWGVCRNH